MKTIFSFFLFFISQASFAQSAIGTIDGQTVICEGDTVKLHCDFSAILGWEVYAPLAYDTSVVKWRYTTVSYGDITVFGRAPGIAKIKCYNTIEEYDTITETVVSCPAGISKISNSVNVAIYPNPTTGNFTVEGAGRSMIRIYNLLGKQVYESIVTADKQTLNVRSLIAGTYIVQVNRHDSVVQNVRVVKE